MSSCWCGVLTARDEKLVRSSSTCRITALYLITTRVTYIPYRDVCCKVMLVSSPLQNKEWEVKWVLVLENTLKSYPHSSPMTLIIIHSPLFQFDNTTLNFNPLENTLSGNIFFFLMFNSSSPNYVHHFVLKTHNSVLLASHQLWFSLDICCPTLPGIITLHLISTYSNKELFLSWTIFRYPDGKC